jgi:hypothetical protein
MKKRILLVAVLQLFLVLNGCSSDSGSDSDPTPEPPVVIIKTAKATSYSKNSGETGETISIYGENFSDKISDIKITFDGVAATIVSSTANEIVFKLPATEKLVPKLSLTIENRTVSNEVKNDYQGNIGILPKASISEWFTMENVLKKDSKIYNMQIFNDKIMYYSMADYGGSGAYRTLDGGITFKEWGRTGFSGAFSATKNDEGWADTSFWIQKVPVGGSATMDFIETAKGGSYYSVYVDSDMKNGTIISLKGDVYTTTNGVDFSQVYDAHFKDEGYEDGSISRSAEIDNNHIWAAGQKTVGKIYYPFILFKNNETDGWKEHYLVNEPNSFVAEVSFADKINGFLLIANSSIYKTINGGDTWSKVYTGEKFTKFTFKDGNTGWAVLENKIYKTTDGGVSWILDYTHDQSIRGISYKNNVVWAFSTDKIIKRYL